MANLSLTTQAEQRRAQPPPVPVGETALVASFGDAIVADYAEHGGAGRVLTADLTRPAEVADLGQKPSRAPISTCVLFLKARLSDNDRQGLDALIPRLSASTFIALVSTFRVHLGDEAAAAVEKEVLDRLQGLKARIVVFRAGHIVGGQSSGSRRLRR